MLFPQRAIGPDAFPALLREIPDAPKLLYIRGVLPPPETELLAVVGSRACTPYGRRMVHTLVQGLARSPVAIVSGLALGIDAEAHKAALDAGLPTIAVLPSSADEASIYPRNNVSLAQHILQKGGALLSENKSPFKPALYSFPQRNRIMAGMCKAILIVEAGEKSGTLITARLALDYNHEVLAIPHELGRESGAGVNRLIREGATLVRSADDIREALGLTTPTTTGEINFPEDLNKIELHILKTLSQPLERDELITQTGYSAQDINIALSSLHIRGLITERLGKIEKM